MAAPKVFISYSRLDDVQALQLYNELKEFGLDAWIDKECLLPGQDWEREIKQAIEKSDFIVLLLSNNSIKRRGYFQKEVRLTLDVLKTIPFGHIYLLPVRLDQCIVPTEISAINYVDLFPIWQGGLKKLVKSIELQSGIQLKARIAENSNQQSKPSVLLVNDQPATMNFVIDLWKSQGLKVDYAFDVDQAIRLIKELSPSAVVSDLSHYSFDKLITERAGFEILEWASAKKIKLNVIITTANLTNEKRLEAKRLGAIGICNSVDELNQLVSKYTGRHIEMPKEINEVDKYISIISDFKDHELYSRIVTDLQARGYNLILDDNERIHVGDVGDSSVSNRKFYYKGEIVLVLLSEHSADSEKLWDFCIKEYDPIWGMPTKESSKYIIPIFLDETSKYLCPKPLEHELPIDFSQEYNVSLTLLIQRLNEIIKM